ncbi:hypothetical protein WN943_007065 [Citrus x changshan-huyou]
MSNPPTVTHPVVSGGAIGLGSPSIPAGTSLSHCRHQPSLTPPTNPSVDYPSRNFEYLSKRTRPIGISDEVNLLVNVLPVSFTGHSHNQAFSELHTQGTLSKSIHIMGEMKFDSTWSVKQYIFEGHEAPVYSVCPHHKENIQVTVLYFYFIVLVTLLEIILLILPIVSISSS